MKTFLVDTKAVKKIEILDDLLFEEGQKLILPLWQKTPFVVSSVEFRADMHGNVASLEQIVYVTSEYL